jgi:hypothetical protein
LAYTAEFTSAIQYISGKDNVLANTLWSVSSGRNTGRFELYAAIAAAAQPDCAALTHQATH